MMTTTSQALSALRTLGYSAEKLADLITTGIADAEVRSQVRAACLRELSWVDTLLAGDDLRLTDAEREAIQHAAATCRSIGRPVKAWPENRWADTIDAFLERHTNGGVA